MKDNELAGVAVALCACCAGRDDGGGARDAGLEVVVWATVALGAAADAAALVADGAGAD